MSDKAAASASSEDTKKATKGGAKKTAGAKKNSALDFMIAEAKAAFGDFSTTGERKLRKRPASTAAPVAKKTTKKAATKAAPKKAASKKAKAVNGKADAADSS